MHFTPTGSSWINQVERWFGYLTDQVTRRGVHKSVQALEADVRAWIDDWNSHPKPFVWKKTAEESSTPSADIYNEFQAHDTRRIFARRGAVVVGVTVVALWWRPISR